MSPHPTSASPSAHDAATRHRPSLRSMAVALVALVAVAATVAVPALTPAQAAPDGPDLDDTPLDDTPWVLPVPPERCTLEQVDTGDVAGCTVVFYDDPSETGWGVPPSPVGQGEGWEWSGARYNGSPILADWEATYIESNTEPVAGFGAGRIETHRDARGLFEGFLNEITDKGYRVRDVTGYGFRCTAGSGGWSCPSGDPDGLSNHAWGLAIDMNSATNPIKSYLSVDGQTACRTPIETDMPKWMIETAEKWGLYWGGYGWNSGCQSLDTQRTVVSRDPPHFEFRGTPEQAAAILAFNLGNDPSIVCRTVIDDEGNEVERCSRSTRPAADERVAVDTAAPEGAVAAMVNLTATDADGPGFLTLETCGPVDPLRATSALTFAPGESVASMAIVPLDADGRFCVYRSTSVHSIVDVAGFLTEVPVTAADDPAPDTTEPTVPSTDPPTDPTIEPLWFSPVPPDRLTDSRLDGACLPQQECRPGFVPAESVHAVPTDSDEARIVNLTVVDARRPGYAQVGRCADVGLTNVFSNINVMNAAARANLALVPAGDTGTCAFTLSEANLIVDELGRLTSGDGLGWSLAPSRRAIDTRECTDDWCDGRPAAGEIVRVDLGTDAPAAAIALTVTGTRGPGYVTAGRCDDLAAGGAERTSNANYAAGQTTTALAVVALDAGEMCVFTLASAHVIVDVQAELVAERTVGVVPVDPARLHDSRERPDAG
jgi:hypothetical protein